MVYRIRFAKYGVLKFIGHLDVMRYFQKAVRRAALPIAYSQGYSPHQIMSFASPLGLGITSDAEYMELELIQDLSETELFERLGGQMTEGFEILAVQALPKPLPNTHVDSSMALVSGAEYRISFKDGYGHPFADNAELKSAFTAFLGQEEITVNKKTKKSEKTLDIKPYIYYAGFADGSEAVCCGPETVHSDVDGTAHADSYSNGLYFTIRLIAGSQINIRPELVLEAFYSYLGLEFNEAAVQLHRTEMYMGTDRLVPMCR